MKDQAKTKEELIDELENLRHKVSELEESQARLKGMERLLREGEQRYKAVVDNIEIGISILNPNMEIVEVNKAFKRYFPHVQPGCGQICYEEYNDPPRSEPCSYCPCVLTLRDGEVHEVITETPAGGETHNYRLVSSPIKDSDGRIRYIIELTQDITEATRAQESLRFSEERYRRLFEDAPLVYVITRNERGIPFIRDCNKLFLRSLGYQREEVVGRPLTDFYSPESGAKLLEGGGYARALAGEFVMGERELLTRDGRLIPTLLYTMTELDPAGQVTGTLAMFVDITERKKAEEEQLHLKAQLFQAQKMESIGTLAGGIAHDFNNLLTIVLGFTDLLLFDKDERNPAYADLQKIHQAAANGADLVKRILTFSRKADFHPRPVNLNREVDQARNLLTRTIPKMIEIDLALSGEIATVNADPVQLEQILMNLAVNAKDAMPERGRLTIETRNIALDDEYCSLHLGAKPGDYVMLSVSDTGHGIDSETLTHIFEPFYTTREAGKGTGLGLAMVYGIVKQHGGYITCDSEPGMGTTFKMYFPVIPTDANSEPPAEKSILPRGAETILLVDDEEYVRDLGRRILERSGYTVLSAVNGKEALDLYKKEGDKISLVILDLIMPEMGGKQCLDLLLKIDPKAKILITSGYDADNQSRHPVESGAKGFVSKPFEVGQILQSVREVLDSDT